MTRARTLADLGSASLATDAELASEISAVPTGRKNLLYNGAMQVAQRSTTSASNIAVDGYYTADRWRCITNSQGQWTQTLETDAPTGSGFRNSFKILCATADAAPAAGDYVWVEQRLEGQDLQRIAKGTADAQQLSLSFWVKSNVTGTHIVNAWDLDNNRLVAASYTVSASAIWEKKTITFPADTTGAFDNDNGLSLRLVFMLGAGTDRTSGTLATAWESLTTANVAVGQTNLAAATNNYWQITGVQLEVGATATEFEFKSFGTELRECQRYYQNFTSPSSNTWVAVGQAYQTAAAIIPLFFQVEMRTTPAVTLATAGLGSGNIFPAMSNSGAPGTVGSLSAITPGPFGFAVQATGWTGAFAVGDAVGLLGQGPVTVYKASAEL